MKLTTTPLVFDVNDRTFLPPINGLGQIVADTWLITVAPRLRKPLLGTRLDTQVRSPVLLVGQIGEPVQPDLVGPALGVVVLVDEPEIVLENLESLLLLPDAVVGLAVLREPRLVYDHHLVVGPPARSVAVALIVGNDRHVQGR